MEIAISPETLARFHIREIAKQALALVRSTRGLIGLDRAIIQNYKDKYTVRKLHIGCGKNILEGWLNADYQPRSSTILHLDATRPFPFNAEEFDFIFTEHMIEHVPYLKGLYMLSECFRVLKKNGTLRISTPDLAFLINLYNKTRSDKENRYIDWATKTYISGAPYSDPIFVINNYVRDWGHQFIYDEATLRSALEKAGFSKIVKCALDKSEHEDLRNKENTTRMPEDFLQLETITLEASKV